MTWKHNGYDNEFSVYRLETETSLDLWVSPSKSPESRDYWVLGVRDLEGKRDGAIIGYYDNADYAMMAGSNLVAFWSQTEEELLELQKPSTIEETKE